MSHSSLAIDDRGWEVPTHVIRDYAPRSHRFVVIIPVVNEGDRLLTLLRRMAALCISQSVDIAIVDGGSTDGSTDDEILKRLNIRAIIIKTGSGKLSAQLRCAYAWALREGYEGIITIDGNNKDDPDQIPAFIAALDRGLDFVQASRFIDGGIEENTPRLRRFAIRWIHAPVLSIASGFRWTDTTQGFRGYSRRLLMDPRVQPFRKVFQGYELLAYMTFIAPYLGFRCVELPTARRYPSGNVPTKISAVRGNVDLLLTLVVTCMGLFRPLADRQNQGPSAVISTRDPNCGHGRIGTLGEWPASPRYFGLRFLPYMLAALAGIYCAYGFAGFAVFNGRDFASRWIENSYFWWEHVDPLDVISGAQPTASTIGPIDANTGQAPWAYVLGVVLIPPVYRGVAFIWFLLIQVASLIGLTAFAIGTMRIALINRIGRCSWVWSSAFVFTACFAAANSIKYGNYALPVCASLACSAALLDAGRSLPAGCFFALAMIKPHVAVPFFFLFVARRDYSAMIFSITTVLLSWLFAGYWTACTPLSMLAKMATQARTYEAAVFGLFDPLRYTGLDLSVIVKLGLATGLGASLVVGLCARKWPTMRILAVLAVISATWTYHWRVDHVVLGFLVLALLEAACRRRSTPLLLLFLCVGTAIWAPLPGILTMGPALWAHFLLWFVGLVGLLLFDWDQDRPGGEPAERTPECATTSRAIA